jgi:hypothetical protein
MAYIVIYCHNINKGNSIYCIILTRKPSGLSVVLCVKTYIKIKYSVPDEVNDFYQFT